MSDATLKLIVLELIKLNEEAEKLKEQAEKLQQHADNILISLKDYVHDHV